MRMVGERKKGQPHQCCLLKAICGLGMVTTDFYSLCALQEGRQHHGNNINSIEIIQFSGEKIGNGEGKRKGGANSPSLPSIGNIPIGMVPAGLYSLCELREGGWCHGQNSNSNEKSFMRIMGNGGGKEKRKDKLAIAASCRQFAGKGYQWRTCIHFLDCRQTSSTNNRKVI